MWVSAGAGRRALSQRGRSTPQGPPIALASAGSGGLSGDVRLGVRLVTSQSSALSVVIAMVCGGQMWSAVAEARHDAPMIDQF